jgi:Regulator of ribonuclease activity B
LTDRPSDSDLALGVDALDTILGDQSELRQLWEAPTDQSWLPYMRHMRDRLGRTEDRDLYFRVEELVDRKRAHRVDWFSYYPTEQSARAVADFFATDELEVDVHPSETGAEWSVTASRITPISYILVMRMTNRIRQIVEAHGGNLDGWGVAV